MALSLIITLISLAYVSADEIFQVESCSDMQEAFDMSTEFGYANVSMHPFEDIICDNFTTFTLDGTDLDFHSTENLENYYGNSNMRNVRFQLINGARLTWETNVLFDEEEDNRALPDVSGGAIYIGTGSYARFFNDFGTRYIGVRSKTDESSDFSSQTLQGGCVFNNGYLRVDGESDMTGCRNSGGGESGAGDGGCIYNDANGTVIFSNGVTMSDVYTTDDEGGAGAGIYNLGRVVLRGSSEFVNLVAEEAGAIYNGKDAYFLFKDSASALFYRCGARDGVAGAIINHGVFKFDNSALFVEGSADYKAGQVYVSSTGIMKMKKNSMFFNTVCSEEDCSAVHVDEGGVLEYADKKTVFVNTESRYGKLLCEGIYFEDGKKCVV